MSQPRKRALISVYDKTQIENAARILHENGWEILSTGGTASHLRSNGIPVTEVSDLTGFPHILDGRVKTLHPMVFGPILARSEPDHLRQLHELNTHAIDLVMVNFYPFEAALEESGYSENEMVERIDIGGPSMVRAAAKNHARVTVVVDPRDYLPVCRNLVQDKLDFQERRYLAQKAFAATAHYDALISAYFTSDEAIPGDTLTFSGRKHLELRYGENPHQAAGLYLSSPLSPLKRMRQLQGKALSFNNILDATMVWEVLSRFDKKEPFCVIVKHQNPCGAAMREQLDKAFLAALEGDPVSAFGGIVGFNSRLDGQTAEHLKSLFLEVVVAPGFTPEAQRCLERKKNLRLLEIPLGFRERNDLRSVPGGFLWQQADHAVSGVDAFQNLTEHSPTKGELLDVEMGWRLIKFVKSNGILVVKDGSLIGVGPGQMNRVEAVRIALDKCGDQAKGAVLISDAFFPFPDSIELAAEKGIRVIVEPGGSIRDKEVIAAAQRLEMVLLFTGMRHFRH